MKRIFFYIAVALFAAGCSSDPEATCDTVTVDGTEYCVYQGAITETGYDCPPDKPHMFRDEGLDLAVCSAQDERPPFEAIDEAWEQQVGEGRNNNSGGPNSSNTGTNTQPNNSTNGPEEVPLVAASKLCSDPQAHDGARVRISADEVSESVGQTLVDCGGCCNSAFTDFVLECDDSDAIVLTPVDTADWPSATGRAETASAVTTPSSNTTQMGCLGQECYQICAPGRLSEVATFTGVFRIGEFFSPAGDGDYPMALEVESFERSGDGCPDFASECPDDCTPIMGRQYDEGRTCVGESRVIGCSSAENATNNLGCVKRAPTTFQYEIFSGSLPDGTDWLTCEWSDLPDWPDCE